MKLEIRICILDRTLPLTALGERKEGLGEERVAARFLAREGIRYRLKMAKEWDDALRSWSERRLL